MAGTGTGVTTSNGFNKLSWLYVDGNGTFYVCDQGNNRIQMWIDGAANGVTVAGDSGGTAGTTSTLLKNPLAVTLDNNGFIYVSDQGNNRVQQFPPSSLTGTTVANPGGGTTAALTDLKNPSGIAVDNNSNIYIADTGNNRLVVWAPNATSGNLLISDGSLANAYGLVLVPGSSNQVYYSTQGGTKSVYWWTFNASSPNVILTQVNGINGNPNALDSPGGMAFDPYGNLYVTDKNPDRVVMYCGNATGVYSTVGTTVIQATDATLKHPIGVGFDSDLNMYVALFDGNYVVRFSRL